jgi:hypothetical protein
MEKKQTAVEWLEWQINLGLSERGLISAIQEAKQMEKEQIVDGWLNGMKGEMIAPLSINNYKPDAEEYYNETYGGNNE